MNFRGFPAHFPQPIPGLRDAAGGTSAGCGRRRSRQPRQRPSGRGAKGQGAGSEAGEAQGWAHPSGEKFLDLN